MANIKVRRITLQKYEQLTKDLTSAPLYVVNTTSKPQGEVVFNVQGESGHRIAAVVPQTFIPIDLTQEVHRSNLLQCAEFKKLLQRGRLAVVDPQSAVAYMEASTRAQAEFKEIYGTEFVSEDDLDMETFENETGDAQDLAESNVQADNEVKYPIAEEILMLDTAGDDERAYSMLNSRGLDMSVDEVQYVANSTTTTRLKDLAMEIIGELENA